MSLPPASHHHSPSDPSGNGTTNNNNNSSNPIVHARSDSDSRLDDLFKVLQTTPGQPQTLQTILPFAKRNLPPSFFKPPEPRSGGHSRENSADSTQFGPVVGGGKVSLSGLPHCHARSASSPAQLPHTGLSTAPPVASLHVKTASVGDYADDASLPLPAGWQLAKTEEGQRYYLKPEDVGNNVHGVVDKLGAISLGNHHEQTTTWVDPRAQDPRKLTASPVPLSHSPGPAPPPPAPNNVALHGLRPLPVGWEQASTPAGEMYFINHNDRTTCWHDPRIPKHLQKPGIKLQDLQQLQQQLQQQQMSIHQVGGTQLPQPPALSPQQQQQQQQQIPQTLSPARQPPSPSQPQLSPQAPVGGTQPPAMRTPQSSSENVRMELMRLQRERDALMKRQREIAQEVWTKENRLKEVMSSPPQQTGDVMNVSTSSVDPFLGQATTNDTHARQNSADSGLGGMGNNYSLPRTPEDFLSNLEEMDTTDGVHKMGPATDFGLDVNMDVGTLGEGGDSSVGVMDSDALVASLNDDELLNDPDVKMDMLTWL